MSTLVDAKVAASFQMAPALGWFGPTCGRFASFQVVGGAHPTDGRCRVGTAHHLVGRKSVGDPLTPPTQNGRTSTTNSNRQTERLSPACLAANREGVGFHPTLTGWK